MRKDRNCQSMPYQIYPNFGGYMPQMPVPAPIMYPQSSYANTDKYSNLETQVNNLERRVTKLESMINKNTNTYNDSNFYMV